MLTIRPGIPADRDALGRYGAALMRQHHASDPRRFLIVDHPETGYGRFLASQLDDDETFVRVADLDGEVVGYVFASLEPVSWKDLRGPCGYVHDVYVDARVRKQGVGRALLEAAIDWFRANGRTQVMLMSKAGNETAQRVFASIGFRPTMVEMTLDFDPGVETPE